VPYLLGEGQAMQYSFYPKMKVYWKAPRLPFCQPNDYLRDDTVKTLDEHDVKFDILVQVQTNRHRMPIENGAALWSEKLARAFQSRRCTFRGRDLILPPNSSSFPIFICNPWRCLPKHRPLGNQSRARRRMNEVLSTLRQRKDNTSHTESTGAETFE
jgi:hypothetical protein